jgi:hypothetical protein
LGEYAIFDLLVSFLGIWLIAPLLSKLLKKVKIIVPKNNWVFLTLPIGIAVHLLFGKFTPMTRNFIDIHGHYLLKIAVIALMIGGMRGIKLSNKSDKI